MDAFLLTFFSVLVLFAAFSGIFKANNKRKNPHSGASALWRAIKYGLITWLLSGLVLMIVESIYKNNDTMRYIISFPLIVLLAYIVYKFAFLLLKEHKKAGYIENNEEESFKVDEKTNKVSCPFKGRILAEADTTLLGFPTTKLEEIFVINDDWTVNSKNGSGSYWIDIDGHIHEGGISLFGGVNPNATLSGNKIGKVDSTGFWVGNDKIGSFSNW